MHLSFARTCLFAGVFITNLFAQSSPDFQKQERTCFQTEAAWSPGLDLATDAVLVYDANKTYFERIKKWREKGYLTHFVTGLAWGNYSDFLTGKWDGQRHDEDIQQRADGSKIEYTDSLFYMMPSRKYINYLKTKIERAIDGGAEAIHLEAAGFWAFTGYSEGFKREWREYYQQEWEDPASSIAARYDAEKLKYHLCYRALEILFAHAKEYARQKGREVRCYVATHSLINSTHRYLISPSSPLLLMPDCDGLIARVEASTIRTLNVYRGRMQERNFETALLEYGTFAAQLRVHAKPIWFMHDPVDDDPAHTWENFKTNYESTVVASLFYPEVARYEVMRSSDRVFYGKYPKHTPASEQRPIPPDYATEVLTVINVLKNMQQSQVQWEAAERGVGILLCDAMMFQREAPNPNDPDLSFFYGLALPLLKHGIFVQPLVLENLALPDYLRGCKVLFLSYRFMKPQKPEWHEKLVAWVRAGGTLIFIDDGQDPYNATPEWWNKGRFKYATPAEHLFELLGVGLSPTIGVNKVGMGRFIFVANDPASYAYESDGPERVLALLEVAFAGVQKPQRQNYLKLARGPYVIGAVFDETSDTSAVKWCGDFIDLFDARLPKIPQKILRPGEKALLFDLSKIDSSRAQVLAGAASVAHEKVGPNHFSFSARGPEKTIARLVIFTPQHLVTVAAKTSGKTFLIKHTTAGNLVWLEFPNRPEGVEISLHWTGGTP
jgi:hypothetical protein